MLRDPKHDSKARDFYFRADGTLMYYGVYAAREATLQDAWGYACARHINTICARRRAGLPVPAGWSGKVADKLANNPIVGFL